MCTLVEVFVIGMANISMSPFYFKDEIYLQVGVNRISVVLDNPLADLASERRGLDLATSVLVFVLPPL
jgi:hypothetical protein